MYTFAPTLAEVKPATALRTMTDAEFRAFVLALAADLDDTTDHALPSGPTPEEEAERLARIADDEAREEEFRDEIMASYWVAEREESMAGHFDAWDALSANELIECRGHHPALAYLS